MLKRTPSDATIARRAAALGELAATLEPGTHAASVAACIEASKLAATSSEACTGRTYNAPHREYAPSTTYAERARAMGGAQSEAASYPVCIGGPQGTPETLAARRMATHLHADALRSAGQPTNKQLRAMARNARR